MADTLDTDDPRDVTPPERPRASVQHTSAAAAVAADEEIRSMSEADLLAGIERLRRERDAVIIAHNYQIPVIQDLADFVGDSLELSREAAAAEHERIVFCGVHFMAETAAILAPDRRVLIPDPEAGCSLASSVDVPQLRAWKAEHPDAVLVAYVNTDAAVKAEVDYCVTSSNAVELVKSIPEDREILFLPDMFLGLYVERMTGRKLHLWLGECHVHAGIRPEDVVARMEEHPEAELLLHPECGCVSQCMYALAEGDLPADRTLVVGTAGMVRHLEVSEVPVVFVGTETGMLHRLRKQRPDKTFIPVREDAVCEYMKTITLPKLYRTLRDDVYHVTVPEEIAQKARLAIDRMVAVGGGASVG
jgi:quinolinate synthase